MVSIAIIKKLFDIYLFKRFQGIPRFDKNHGFKNH